MLTTRSLPFRSPTPRTVQAAAAAGFASTLAFGLLSAPALAGLPPGGVGLSSGPLGAISSAFGFSVPLLPGQLLVSRSVYTDSAGNIVPGVTVLPPSCATGCVKAVNDATYPFVWNNDRVDSSFGITSKIFLDQVTPFGFPISSIEVPNSTQRGVGPSSDQLVTSFPSKSELALNLSTDGRDVTFMGYVAPVGALDVSNSNTPAAPDPTNPVGTSDYRAVATLDVGGRFHFTETNAYSGNNGRAAILDNAGGANAIYTAGNAGNGGKLQPNGVLLGGGAQFLTPSIVPESAQLPGAPTPVGSFNITELGLAHDKIGKDNNFRGETVFDNVLYYTKGSGGNGVNTVYFVDTTGHACPNGVGLPVAGAALPTGPIAVNMANLATQGVTPNNMCILRGFNTALAATTTNVFPFGIWFADSHTLYVADEGNGDTTYSPATGRYTGAATQTTAGLQKWVLTDGTWQRAYVLQNGLKLGVPNAIAGYPTAINPMTALPWAPATDGLRNITGRVDGFGHATIWGVTSTVSGSGDQGADPNQVVTVTDQLDAASAPAGEAFRTIRSAGFAEVLRGVSFTPGTKLGGF